MHTTLFIIGLLISSILSVLFSALTYSLRDFSRAKLTELMDKFAKTRLLGTLVEHTADLVFITAVLRLFANLFILLFCVRIVYEQHWRISLVLLAGGLIAGVITLFTSVAVPNALAKYGSEMVIAIFAEMLAGLRIMLSPITGIMHFTDSLVKRASGASENTQPQQLEQDILSAVEEGEKEGIVDTQEREMIQSVIEFRDTNAGQIMTARPDILGIELHASLAEVKTVLEESGHSRIPIYDGAIDKIVGILYARDLLHHLGLPAEQFDIRSAMRPAFFVPETKPLRDLLRDFRLQKVHIAIVIDEYGGTAGLITIEDILEELVGEIADEHEPEVAAAVKKLSEQAWDVDATMSIAEINRVTGINIPEDGEYETLAGFVTEVLGRIPVNGETFEHSRARFTVLSAEPARVTRVKVELIAAGA